MQQAGVAALQGEQPQQRSVRSLTTAWCLTCRACILRGTCLEPEPAWGQPGKSCQPPNRPFTRVLALQGEQSQEQVLGWMKREMVAKANEIKVSLL